MPDPGSHAYEVKRTGRAASRSAPAESLGLGEGATATELRDAAEGHVVARGTLAGVVAR